MRSLFLTQCADLLLDLCPLSSYMLDTQWTVTVFKLDKQINDAIKCFLFCFFYHLMSKSALFLNVFEHPLTQCV